MRKMTLSLLLALGLGAMSGCEALKSANIGVSLSPDGVSLTVGSSAWRDQVSGVAEWAKWLSGAPTDEAEKHLPGVSAWLKKLAGA